MIRKYIITLLLFVITLPFFGQSNSAQKVLLEVNELKSSESLQDVIKYLEDRKTAFNFNNLLDKFIYNLQLGIMNYNLGKYHKAYSYLQTTTQICDAQSSTVFKPENDFLVTYYWLAVSAFRIGQSRSDVLEKLNRAQQVFILSKLTETATYQTILNDIKLVQSDEYTFFVNASEIAALSLEGKYNDAIPRYQKLLLNFPNSKNFLEKAQYLDGLARCFARTGQLKKAEEIYLNTINKLTDLKAQNHEVYWYLCDGLGVVYSQLHNYKKALHFTSTAKRLHELNLDFGDGYIRCLANCAIIEDKLGHYAIAKILMDVALNQMRLNYLGNKNKIDNLSISAQDEKPNLKSSIDINLKIKPMIQSLSNASLVYFNAGYRDESISCIKESIELSKLINEESTLALNNLGMLYMLESKIEQADSCFNVSYKSSNNYYEKEQVAHNLALSKWYLNKKDAGLFSLDVSNQIKNNLSFNFGFFTEDERDEYWSHLELYLPALNLVMYDSGMKKLRQDIYDNILFEKGLLLRSSNRVREAVLSSGNQALIEIFNQKFIDQRELIKEKDKGKQESLKARIENADRYLIKNIKTYERLQTKVSWEDVKNKLSTHEIAIEFYNIPFFDKLDSVHRFDGEPRLCALILKAEYKEPHIIPLCLENKLNNISGENSEELKDLYSLIWEPMSKELTGVKRIYFSPYRKLHALPIEYLLDKKGHFMNEKYEMYRLSSTSELVENRAQNNEFKNVSLYGGLIYDLTTDEYIAASTSADNKKRQVDRTQKLEALRDGIKYLPGTQIEVNSILSLFKQHNITPKLYSGLKGTEESFKKMSGTKSDIIHISTHGFYWSDEEVERKGDLLFLKNIQNTKESMNHAGLFMTGANITLKGQNIPDNIDDGILTAQEISLLNLGNVNLVVLSACQTGLGEINNDAVYGLQRGFKLSGAKSLLVSLWKVNDKATMILMTEFYKQLLSGKSKVESLKIAQRHIQNRFGADHPEYWAGFIFLDALD